VGNGMARTRTLSEDITAIWHWTSIDGEYAPLHYETYEKGNTPRVPLCCL
jgi:hypothetical protein